ncbi:Hint domain-containing protein [Roseivivax sp. CAU 1753]
MGYQLTVYDWSLFTIPSGIPMADIQGDTHANDPNSPDYASSAPSWIGETFTYNGGSGIEIIVSDDDDDFEDAYVETGGAQTLAQPVTINGTTYPAGSTIENEFSMLDDLGNEVWVLRINGTNVGFIYAANDQPTAGESFTASTGRDGAPEDSGDGAASSEPYRTVDTSDGIVSGTVGDDSIDAAYSGDPDGDQIDDGAASGPSGNANTVNAGDGNDTVLAGQGDDTVFGEAGNDFLQGQAGNDSLVGGDGADIILGGIGNDVLQGDAGNDSLYGEAGDDTVIGGDGNDVLYFGAGNDSLRGDAGSDQFIAVDGFGNDTVVGGEMGADTDFLDFRAISSGLTITFGGDEAGSATAGTDTVTFSEIENIWLSNQADVVDGSASTTYMGIGAGDGNDTVVTGSGDDLVLGQAGNDSLEGGAGSDSVDGGLGNDTILGGIGNDSLTGGNGDDDIDGGDGADTISGGADNDVLSGNGDADSILGGDGDDIIFGGDGDDIVDGGTGADTVYGGQGADSITGGDGADYLFGDDFSATGGNDTIDGGAGDDTLHGNAGDDVLTGGGDNDLFMVSDGNDTITDFNFGNTGALGDGNIFNNDYIDLSGYYDNLDEVRADQADDSILNQSNAFDDEGNAVDYSDNIQFGASSLTMLGATASSYTADNTGIVCFTAGTRILTPRGPVAIEKLKIGDFVVTQAHGAQPLAWIGRRQVGRNQLEADIRLRPILICKGSLGNERDLLVSRQHGMLIGADHLVRAVHLAENSQGVRIAHGKREVTYIHLMFEAHQIIFAEGIPSESFFPGPMALKTMSPDARQGLEERFPALRGIKTVEDAEMRYCPLVRPFAKKKCVKALLDATKPYTQKERHFLPEKRVLCAA